MWKWIKQKFLARAINTVASRWAYQPTDRMVRILATTQDLAALAKEQMQDGEWIAAEKAAFCEAVAAAIATIMLED